jgi:hypothetical protein
MWKRLWISEYSYPYLKMLKVIYSAAVAETKGAEKESC